MEVFSLRAPGSARGLGLKVMQGLGGLGTRTHTQMPGSDGEWWTGCPPLGTSPGGGGARWLLLCGAEHLGS